MEKGVGEGEGAKTEVIAERAEELVSNKPVDSETPTD